MYKYSKGFTLVELLVVISIIAFISSVVFATLATARKKSRDSARIQNARQIALALEQYNLSSNTYKLSNAGYNNEGSGYISKGSETPGYTNSIIASLKQSGYINSASLMDPIYGTDNYYIGLCTSTNAYNVFVKLEQPEYNQATSSITNACGGIEASALGFSFIASTAGGSSGGGTSGYSGSTEDGVGTMSFNGLTYNGIVAEDGRVWLDRNLGATRVATSYNDTQTYGHYYQWGRGTDGHQIGTSGITSATSSSNTPGHGNFITINSGLFDWRSPQNFSLWQGVNGINNPCPTGFRLPTEVEWQTWITALGGFTTATCGAANTCRDIAFNSSLKLSTNGVRYRSDAVIYDRGLTGYYWSSSVGTTYNKTMYFGADVVWPVINGYHANGFAARCIKN